MGYRLYREVVHYAPADLTSGELVVAWVIADDASDDTRQSWIRNDELCFRTRMGPSGVRAALGKLAARGLEFRVIHGYDRRGNPVYAAKGHSVDYLVPDFFRAATPVSPSGVDNPLKGAARVSPYGPAPGLKGDTTVRDGDTTVAALRLKGDTAVSPLSSENLNHLTLPSVDPAVVTTSLEGTSDRQVKPGHLSQLPALTQLEEFERQAAGLREFEKRSRAEKETE